MKAIIRLVLPAILSFALAVGIILPALTPDAVAGAPNTVASIRVDSEYLTIASITPKIDSTSDSEVSIRVDGRYVRMPYSVILIDSATYVPLYDFSMIMGTAKITQDDENVTVSLPGLLIDATADNSYFTANGRYLYVPSLCRMIDNVMYVPIRPLAKAFGAEIKWASDSRTVDIFPSSKPIESGSKFYDETDLYWMSRIISAEARGECMDGKIAVGHVIMNRLRSSSYPDTVRGVIFDKRSGIQFSPAYSGSINRTPDQECVIAAKLALDDANVVGDSLFFNASRIHGWASRNRTFVATIGNHTFYA